MATLYLLGTGTPTPTPERFGTSSVLQLDDDYLMFDCGPATTYKLVKAGLFPTMINHLFFTHHHFDHIADYPCFLLCRWDQSTGKESPLTIYGPKPTKEITQKLIGPDGAFASDWKARVQAPSAQHLHVNRGGTLPRPEPAYEVLDVEPGEITANGAWKVAAAEVHHAQPWLESLAYRVSTEKGTIVFAGDTGFCPELTKFADGADVLLAMCWDHQQIMDSNGENQGVLGTTNAAKIAKEAGVKRLILTHTGSRVCEPGGREKAIADVTRIYHGEIIFAEELMTVELC